MQLLVLLAFVVTSLAGIQHIADVDPGTIPAYHQREFLSALVRPSKRRELFSLGDQFFRVNDVRLPDGSSSDFILKQDLTEEIPVYSDGKRVDTPSYPTFHGYSAEDYLSVIVLSFPSLHADDNTPDGFVMWAGGQGHNFRHHPEHGLVLEEHDTVFAHPEHLTFNAKAAERIVPGDRLSKVRRNLEQIDTGVSGSTTMLSVNLLIETTNDLLPNQFGGDQAQATAFITNAISLSNVIYQRDIRVRWIISSINYHPNNDQVASDLTTLNNYLVANPSKRTGIAAAVLFQGSGSTGTGYVGTVCKNYNTLHVPLNVKDKFWATMGFCHESGHVLGSGHTHDGYTPHVDDCGTSGVQTLPPGGVGSIMSYCHLVPNRLGYKNLQLIFGAVGKYGTNSERVTTKMRATLEAGKCGTAQTDAPNTNYTVSGPGALPTLPGGSSPNPPPPTTAPPPTTTPPTAPPPSTTPPPTTTPPTTPPPTTTPPTTPPTATPKPTPTPTPTPVTPSTGSCTDDPSPRVTMSDGSKASCVLVKKYNYCSYALPPYCMTSCNGCTKKRELEDLTVPPTAAASGIELIVSTDKTLYDQGAVCVANKGVPSSYYKTMMAHSRALDDFVVPAGETWHISSLTIMGSWFGDSHTVNNTRFGITVFNRNHIVCRSDIMVDSFVGGEQGRVTTLKLDLPCITVGGYLEADRTITESDEAYYLTVYPRLDYANGANSWHWSFSKTTNGEHFKYKDMEGVLQTGSPCVQWTDASKCGLNIDESNYDLCFQLTGLSTPTTSSDVEYLDLPTLPLTDGDIGTDVGHGRLLTNSENEKRKTTSTKFAIDTVETLYDSSPERVASVDGRTPGYVIALAVLAGVAGLLLLVIAAVLIAKHNQMFVEYA